jgi:acetyltransferase-like isoleucine patch superfamily enzyme
MAGLSTSPALQNASATPYSKQRLNYLGITKKDRRITVKKNDVWIRDGAVILPDVTVESGAVIGANSVLTKNIHPYAVVAGCPAKIIKYRFLGDIIE